MLAFLLSDMLTIPAVGMLALLLGERDDARFLAKRHANYTSSRDASFVAKRVVMLALLLREMLTVLLAEMNSRPL